jgi:small-conductance mechanosensitive channel
MAVIALGIVAGALTAILIKGFADPTSWAMGWPAPLRLLFRRLVNNTPLIVFVALVAGLRTVLLASEPARQTLVLSVAINLVGAWIVIHLLASFIHNRFAFRLIALTAWIAAALSILGLLDAASEALDGLAIQLGGFRLSLLLITKVTVLLIFTLWVAGTVGTFIETRLRQSRDLTPSIQVLVGKVVRLALIAGAILIVLGSAGIDLTALAWFSGAVGVGIGFGLQKVVSNIVSGIILLADKSVKPGDIISVGSRFGLVRDMGTRYISVLARDGREVLIPNEDLVTHQVINWSYSKDEVRLDLKFSVDPVNDPHKVRAAALEAIKTVPRVYSKIPPACHFVGLDSRSMDFLMRFWIEDPEQGVTNVRGVALLALWDAFKREGIAFPSPIQDMRLRGTANLQLDEPLPRHPAPETIPD